jgi:hypothetical protein
MRLFIKTYTYVYTRIHVCIYADTLNVYTRVHLCMQQDQSTYHSPRHTQLTARPIWHSHLP